MAQSAKEYRDTIRSLHFARSILAAIWLLNEASQFLFHLLLLTLVISGIVGVIFGFTLVALPRAKKELALAELKEAEQAKRQRQEHIWQMEKELGLQRSEPYEGYVEPVNPYHSTDYIPPKYVIDLPTYATIREDILGSAENLAARNNHHHIFVYRGPMSGHCTICGIPEREFLTTCNHAFRTVNSYEENSQLLICVNCGAGKRIYY